jgi:hypothetical protein
LTKFEFFIYIDVKTERHQFPRVGAAPAVAAGRTSATPFTARNRTRGIAATG